MLTLKLDNRRLIPVRLIPFITGWWLPPDVVAGILAGTKPNYRISITSYHLNTSGKFHPILPKEWFATCADLDALDQELSIGEVVHNQNYGVWRTRSIKLLLPGTFVWLDKLETAWNEGFSEERMDIIYESPGDRELNLMPRIPADLADQVYEGFELLLTSKTAEPDKQENRFILTGDHWSITYGGKTHTFNNSMGMRYIAWLLQHQGKEIHVRDLYYAINPPDSNVTSPILSSMNRDQFDELGLSLRELGDAGDLMTPEGKKRIWADLERLKEQIDEAEEFGNEDEKFKLESMREEILNILSIESGLGGTSRKASSDIERIRKAVSKRIKNEIKKVLQKNSTLGHHLSTQIQTGTLCRYAPQPPIKWKLFAN